MKRLLVSLILFSVFSVQADVFRSSVRSTQETNSKKKNDDGVVHFATVEALHAYDDCINGPSGDFKKTGCKSEECWTTCEAIARTADAAKKEKIYDQYATCVFGNNKLHHGRWGRLGGDGCHIRKKRCWDHCLAWAREKASKGIPVRSYPHPEIPPAPQPKSVHKKAVVDTVTQVEATPQSTPTPQVTKKTLFWGSSS